MTSPALLSWLQTTILIENDWGETGSGFLVTRIVADDRAKAFLVTNKHVLNRDLNLRMDAQEIIIRINIRETDNSIVGKTAILPLHYADSSRRWREHLDPDIGVLVFDVTSLIINFPQLEKRMADYSVFADREKLREQEIDIGDEVLVIGYPIGIKQGRTNHPIVRSGIIATKIDEQIQDEIEEGGIVRQRMLRGFLVDGATVPGSSGSPVILKPRTGRYVQGNIQLNEAPAFLLGIIAETYYAPVRTPKWEVPSFAGLGLAFGAETVKETIELFFQ